VYDGNVVIGEFDADNVLQRCYLWGEDINGGLGSAGGVGGLLAVSESGSHYFPAYNGNGDVMVYFDASGNIVAEYVYDVFGRRIMSIGTKANDFVYGFSTQRYNYETGDISYLHRDYTPDLGCWRSRDPIQEQGGVNLYGFVGNNPVSKWDYLGRDVPGYPPGYPANPVSPGIPYDPNSPQTPYDEKYDSERRLALQLMLHYASGGGRLFTKGADVVKKQEGVKGPIIPLLQKHAMSVLKSRSVENGEINWRMADTGSIVAQDSFWMLHTLNGATDFEIRGSFSIIDCTVIYNLKYEFIDIADLHMFRNGTLLFPDWIIILNNYTNPLWHLNLINQEYNVRIPWNEESKITKKFPGYKLEGWPFE